MAINFLSSINLNRNELIKARIENQPDNTFAGTGLDGQLYFDTTLDVLKVWANGAWTQVGGVTSFTASNGTFINLTPTTSQTGAATLTANLSATGTASSSTYLRGDNTWSTLPAAYTGWTLAGNTGTSQTVGSGDTVSILGGTLIGTVASATDTLTINHGAVTRTNPTSSVSPGFGGSFTAIDSVTTSAEGHVTAVNTKTVTLPAQANQTITLSGNVTGSGTTAITTTIATDAVTFAMINNAVTITAAEGIASNNNDVTLPTSAAVKSYVDNSLVGSLVFQGGYNASTNTPNLDTPPTGTIKKGFMWTVTNDGLFFTEQMRVGDSLIANIDTPTTLADWTRVQTNIDLATLSTVGIGNVNAGTGIDVSYSNGTATVSAQATSYSTTISATGTITHNLGTRDVIIQLYDTVTYDTLYSDNVRTTTNTATITFAVAPTNPVRVVVQK